MTNTIIFPKLLLEKAQALLLACRKAGLQIVTAESCTGGLVAASLTEIPNYSDVMLGGFVTYCNDMKTACLKVDKALLEKHGAVSEEVARAMAEGALHGRKNVLSLAVTGVAGPGGGSLEKPVGTVHIACALIGMETEHREMKLSGTRHEIRMHSALDVIELARHTVK